MGDFYIALTYACQLSCINCPIDTWSHRSRRLGLAEFKQMFATTGFGSGLDSVVLSGGEPTLHTQLLEMVDFVTGDMTSNLHILSNSNRFADASYVEKLSMVGHDRVTVTTAIYSHVPSIHDDITQRTGSFERTIRGLKNLMAGGIKISLKTVIQRKNYTNLAELAQYVNANFPSDISFSFEGIDLVGLSAHNLSLTGVRVSELAPYLELALDEVVSVRPTSVHALPLCGIDPFYWAFFASESKEHMKRYKTPQIGILNDYAAQSGTNIDVCEQCIFETICPGIWYSYQSLFGTDELVPFLENPIP